MGGKKGRAERFTVRSADDEAQGREG